MVGESAVPARKQPVGRCWEVSGVSTRAQVGDSLVGISPEAWGTFRLMSCPCAWREAEG